MRPSGRYDYAEAAIRAICCGCQKAGAWIDDPDRDTPECAMRIVMDYDFLDDDGVCPSRI